MNSPLSCRALLVLLLSLAPLPAWSFELLPISREFTASGSGATQSYEVVNRGAEPIAISVSVLTRALDVEGAETNRSADDDFLVYPPQFIVGPGKRQTLRVSWLGDPVVRQELAYRLLVEQVLIERFLPQPVGGGPVSARVIVLTNYKASIYIKPPQPRAELVVESALVEAGAAGGARLVIKVRNQGSGRATLKDFKFRAKTSAGERILSVATLTLPSSVVLPGGERRLAFPCPEELAHGAVVASAIP